MSRQRPWVYWQSMTLTPSISFPPSFGQRRLLSSWLTSLHTSERSQPKNTAPGKPVNLEASAVNPEASAVTTQSLAHYLLTTISKDSSGMRGLLGDEEDLHTCTTGSGEKRLLIPDYVTHSQSSCKEEERELASWPVMATPPCSSRLPRQANPNRRMCP